MNQEIVKYLQEGLRRGFSLNILKQKLIEGGFEQRAVNEAVEALNNNKPAPTPTTQQNVVKPVVTNAPNPLISKPEIKTQQKQQFAGGTNWMKIGGIMGIIFLVLGLFSSVIVLLMAALLSNIIIVIAISLIYVLLFSFYYAGFAKMGRVTESGALRISSIATIIFVALFAIVNIAYNLLGESSVSSILGYVVLGMIGLIIIFQLVFSIGLIKASKEIKFAKAAGIFDLLVFMLLIAAAVIGFMAVYGAEGTIESLSSGDFGAILDMGIMILILLLVILLTSFIKFLGMIFEILSLFNGSKKFEQGTVIIRSNV